MRNAKVRIALKTTIGNTADFLKTHFCSVYLKPSLVADREIATIAI